MTNAVPPAIQHEEETGQVFIISDDAGADWYLEKLLEHDADATGIAARYATKIDRLTQLRDEQIAAVKADKRQLIRMYESNFQAYMTRRINEAEKRSLRLTHGEVRLRMVGRSVKVADESKAIAYAREHLPECVAVTLRKDDYLKAFKATGEELPGLKISPARETFSYDGQEKEKDEE